MEQATKRSPGRPKKQAQEAPAKQPKKEIFKAFEQVGPTHHEYELTSPNGMYFMMKAGPVSVYDEASDSIRAIRYIPREQTIYVEEQTSKPVKQPIIFENGRLWVRRNQPNLKAFLDAHPSNEANGGNVFRKVDLSKSAKLDMDSEFEVVDALSLLRSKPLSDLLAVATAFGMNTERPADEIKHDLLIFAKKSPKAFIEAFDNPVVDAKAKIRKAMSSGIVNQSKGHVRWTDSNAHIVAVPAGQDAVDVFTRYCMTEAGAPVLAEIERQL
jgi:hypothetical protein